MIVLKNLTKTFTLNGQRKTVANRINAVFPTGVSVGLIGRNGAGKSTLLRLIAGTAHPTSGEVLSDGSVSFPVGLASALHGDMTGAQNTRFVARIYGADTTALMEYVEDFAELGTHFHLPVRSYSSGMKGRLSFGINMGLKFDTYLIDEVTAVGDASFKKKSSDVFLERMQDSGAVFVSHSMGQIRELCTAGAYIDEGQLTYYPEVDEAIDRYMFSMLATSSVPGTGAPADGPRTGFPADTVMLYGLGLSQTRSDWVQDCLRRHRPCLFRRTRTLHYFDTRAGRNDFVVEHRRQAAEALVQRARTETGPEREATLRQLAGAEALNAIYAAPAEGPERHAAYVDYLVSDRKTQPVICDFTATYALLDMADFKDMASIGWARFVVVLREPAERLWAQIWALLPSAARSLEGCIARAEEVVADPALLADYPESDYARLLHALERAVDPGRVFWLFHEELTGRAALQPLCEFLEIPNILPENTPPLPIRHEPDLPPLLRDDLQLLLAPQYDAMEARFGARLPALWRARRQPDRKAGRP